MPKSIVNVFDPMDYNHMEAWKKSVLTEVDLFSYRGASPYIINSDGVPIGVFLPLGWRLDLIEKIREAYEIEPEEQISSMLEYEKKIFEAVQRKMKESHVPFVDYFNPYKEVHLGIWEKYVSKEIETEEFYNFFEKEVFPGTTSALCNWRWAIAIKIKDKLFDSFKDQTELDTDSLSRNLPEFEKTLCRELKTLREKKELQMKEKEDSSRSIIDNSLSDLKEKGIKEIEKVAKEKETACSAKTKVDTCELSSVEQRIVDFLKKNPGRSVWDVGLFVNGIKDIIYPVSRKERDRIKYSSSSWMKKLRLKGVLRSKKGKSPHYPEKWFVCDSFSEKEHLEEKQEIDLLVDNCLKAVLNPLLYSKLITLGFYRKASSSYFLKKIVDLEIEISKET